MLAEEWDRTKRSPAAEDARADTPLDRSRLPGKFWDATSVEDRMRRIAALKGRLH